MGSMIGLEEMFFFDSALNRPSLEAFVHLCQQYKGNSQNSLLLPSLTRLYLLDAFDHGVRSTDFFTAIGEAASSVLVNLRELQLDIQRPFCILPGLYFALQQGAFAMLEKMHVGQVKFTDDEEEGFATLCQALKGAACGKTLNRLSRLRGDTRRGQGLG